jgi:hypothetical protein
MAKTDEFQWIFGIEGDTHNTTCVSSQSFHFVASLPVPKYHVLYGISTFEVESML